MRLARRALRRVEDIDVACADRAVLVLAARDRFRRKKRSSTACRLLGARSERKS